MFEMFDLGNVALAEGALHAGCNFFAGYPITPSSEIMHYMAKNIKRNNGVFVQMEDEIASIAACIGASWSGAKAMTATSGPGFSLMQENLGYAYMTETPIVVVDNMRTGPSTGQATKPSQQDFYQARYGSHGDYGVIALSPWSVQEMYDFAVKAFNLSEIYRCPVVVLCDGEIAHVREKFERKKLPVVERKIPEKKVNPFFGNMPKLGLGWELLVTGSSHREDGVRDYAPEYHQKILKRIVFKIERNREKICEIETEFFDDADVVIVSYGVSARVCYGAVLKLREMGEKIAFLRLKTLWPFPELRKYLKGREVFVVEMNMGQCVREVEREARKDVKLLSFVGGVVPKIQDIVGGVLNAR